MPTWHESVGYNLGNGIIKSFYHQEDVNYLPKDLLNDTVHGYTNHFYNNGILSVAVRIGGEEAIIPAKMVLSGLDYSDCIHHEYDYLMEHQKFFSENINISRQLCLSSAVKNQFQFERMLMNKLVDPVSANVFSGMFSGFLKEYHRNMYVDHNDYPVSFIQNGLNNMNYYFVIDL